MAKRAMWGRRGVLAAAGCAVAASPARADDPVDLLLVLAVDISRSIDDDESRLQREGYVRAFQDPQVIAAIQGGMIGSIGVCFLEWAGADYQQLSVPWTLIDGPVAAARMADRISGLPRVGWSRTSISAGILASLRALDRAPFEATRRVVDVSGDGPNNHGPPMSVARAEAEAAGVTINGLPILGDQPGGWAWGGVTRPLDRYYEDEVAIGPGCFVEPASGFDTFGSAVRRKLIREIASL